MINYKKIKKAFKKIEELLPGVIVINLMKFNNEDLWEVLYDLWFTGTKQIIFNKQTYTIYFREYVNGDTSTPRFEINRLSPDEVLDLDKPNPS